MNAYILLKDTILVILQNPELSIKSILDTLLYSNDVTTETRPSSSLVEFTTYTLGASTISSTDPGYSVHHFCNTYCPCHKLLNFHLEDINSLQDTFIFTEKNRMPLQLFFKFYYCLSIKASIYSQLFLRL